MKTKIDEDYIKSLPLTTNRIEVIFDKEAFFSKYAIVSYSSKDRELKNLAYEQLADLPSLSVTGLRARWSPSAFPSVKFFILVKKGEENDVLMSLRNYDKISSNIDNLILYPDNIQKRIIASLVINSLGKKTKGRMMYNDGSLLICDDLNFLVKETRKELVCLKIEVNEYMILTAKATSFSHPRDIKELGKHKKCVFQESQFIDGTKWMGRTVKPVVVKDVKKDTFDVEKLYIKKKRFTDNKNNVPYWPYNIENYSHGKLFAIWQVIESVNKEYNPIVSIQFCNFPVLHYDACKTGEDMLDFMKDYLRGKSISFEDPFGTVGSQSLILDLKKEMQNIMDNQIVFPDKPSGNEMIIKLCEPVNDDLPETLYTKSVYRFAHSGNALQHITYSIEENSDKVSKAFARRILIELMVKDCLINRKLPGQLANQLSGWEFIRYKINEDFVHGASLTVGDEDSIHIKEFGLNNDSFGELFEQFASDHLKFNDYSVIKGSRDYMAMIKKGNVYLIIDTDEIPILDAELIDKGYEKIDNGEVPLSFFKRKAEAHKYLRGYKGFHLWKTDGINGEPGDSYSYIAGTNSENMQIKVSDKMDKMPRARRIFILYKEQPETVESEIMEIAAMLKFGFGRWNELMTYPFPFKFLQEYLDDACETAFSKHWDDITYKGPL